MKASLRAKNKTRHLTLQSTLNIHSSGPVDVDDLDNPQLDLKIVIRNLTA
jgi:hypothetical protein